MVSREMLTATPDLLGRRPRAALSPGHVTGRAYGSGGYTDLQIQTDARTGEGGGRATQPGGNRDNGGSSSFGGLRYPTGQAPGPWPNDIGGSGGAYGGGWADGLLTVRDRHVMTRTGTVRNPGLPDSTNNGNPSPDAQAPPPRRFQMVNTTESWQLGTDNTANQDNHGEHFTTEVGPGAPGKRYPLGTQDGTLTLVMGPPLGEWRDYGVRGPSGMHGPAPDVIDPNWIPRRGAGGGGGRGRITEHGAPGQQPGDRRTVYGGVPHGLHSPTAAPRRWTMSRQASIPQMTPPRVDRPLSAKTAGQSMSQGFPPEGSDTAMPMPRQPGGRMAGLGSRFLGRV
jgi:hypothetical protein